MANAGSERLIGIDAGSKTLKVAILEDGHLLHAYYKRHRSDIKSTLAEALHDLTWRFGDIEGRMCITGSAGIGLAQLVGLPFVQEVIATTRAVRHFQPDADAFIELGGEDAKIVYLTGGFEQRMNATCAGGTGGFIDTMAYMLGVRTASLGELAMGARRTYPLASRCAVFAQSDVRPLLNAGASKADLAASVLDAVVAQTMGGLACGRPVQGRVVYLGGPFEYVGELAQRFNRTAGLDGTKPEHAHLYTAAGAALSAEESHAPLVSLRALEERLKNGRAVDDDLERLPALFDSAGSLAAFRTRHDAEVTPRLQMSKYEGPAYLGLDAGSTTVKLALLSQDGQLLYNDYRNVEGNVVGVAKKMLQELYRIIPRSPATGEPLIRIMHSTVCGYGEDLLRAAFGVDSGVVETTAHVRAAAHFAPDVSFVLDIGGQDMKALWVHEGEIVDAVLNEACSSGCGSFVSGTAHALKLSPQAFSDAAVAAESPVDLGTKCTVFMTSRVRHAQKIGASVADIAAGIAYSVVRNALYRIIGRDRLGTLGTRIVVQGGAFKSDAVLAAFEKTVGLEVLRPDTAHLMGAIGCALVARDRALARSGGAGNALTSGRWPMPTPSGSSRPLRSPERAKGPEGEGAVAAERAERSGGTGGAPGTEGASTLLGPDEVAAVSDKSRAATCPGCANACKVSVMDFGGGRSFVSGNRCSRAYAALGLEQAGGAGAQAGEAAAGEQPPNAVARAQELLEAFGSQQASGPRAAATVGLLNTLDGFQHLPFWHTALCELGFSVELPQTSRAHSLRVKAGESIPSESVCWPAKLSHERLYALVEAGAQAVFMPRQVRGSDCAVTCGFAAAVEDAAPPVQQGELTFVSPCFESFDPGKLAGSAEAADALAQSLAALCGQLGVPAPTVDEAASALAAGLRAQQRYEDAVRQACDEALAWAHAMPGRHAALLAGRPYHLDPDVLHGIDRVLAGLGFAVLPGFGPGAAGNEADATAGDPAADAPADAATGTPAWPGSTRLDAAAAWTHARPQVELVCLRSFSCGYDALAVERVREQAERDGRLFTALKIDGIVDVAHIGIRLRTLAEAVEGHPARPARASRADLPARADSAPQPAPESPTSRRVEGMHAFGLVSPFGWADENPTMPSVLPPDAQHGLPPAGQPAPATTAARAARHVNFTGTTRTAWPGDHNAPAQLSPRGFKANAALLMDSMDVDVPLPGMPHAGIDAQSPAVLQSGLNHDDLECARRSVPTDLCYTAAMLAARVIGAARENVRLTSVSVPNVCRKCLVDALPELVERAVGRPVAIEWTDSWPAPAPAATAPAMAAAEAPTPAAQLSPLRPQDPLRIGLVGNPLLVFDPFMNDRLVEALEELGCTAVAPDPALLYTDDVRYLPALAQLHAAGCDHVIYLQSFCCLKGHVSARGNLHALAAAFPNMPVTVIDYDAESAALSRENRVRLAVEAARLARPTAPLSTRVRRGEYRWLSWAWDAAEQGNAQLLLNPNAWQSSGEAALAYLLEWEDAGSGCTTPEQLEDALRGRRDRCLDILDRQQRLLQALEGALGTLDNLQHAIK